MEAKISENGQLKSKLDQLLGDIKKQEITIVNKE